MCAGPSEILAFCFAASRAEAAGLDSGAGAALAVASMAAASPGAPTGLAPGAGGAAVDLGVGDTYMEVAAKLNGKSASICRDFTDTIVNVGADLVKALTRFKLVQPPAAGEELEVSVNGRVIPQDATNGWTYLLDTQEIEFNGTEVPPTGARISITYVPSRPAA